jgi:hypothetical protein
MEEVMNPMRMLEEFFFKTLALLLFKPAYDRGEFVLLHVYFAGHGYMNIETK